MSEMSPEPSQNVNQGSAQGATPLPPEINTQGEPQNTEAGQKSTPSPAEASSAAKTSQPDRLQFLERLVATNDTLRKAYQQAFETQSESSDKPTPDSIASTVLPMDDERMVTEFSLAADKAYAEKVDESHQQVVSLFDKLMPGMASLVDAQSKTEGQKAFLGHLEALFEEMLVQKYPPKLWFSPQTHQELVGRLVPVARQLAREMGLLTPEGAFKFAYSRQRAGLNQSSQAQGAALQAGYVEPSSQNMPAKERAFDKAFREKDTLAMVRALFHRNS